MLDLYFITIFELGFFFFSFGILTHLYIYIYMCQGRKGGEEEFPLPTPGGLIVQALMGLLIFYFPSLGVKVTDVKCRPIVPDNTSQNCMCMRCCDVNKILVTGMMTGVI